MNETHTPTATSVASARRISWAAVFAGVVVALVIQLLLGVIGLSVGASTIDPLQEASPAAGLSRGAGIWFAISALIALFAGGWVAGRMAGMSRRVDTAMHGFLCWGLATLAMTYLLTTTVGGLVSGATGILGKSLAAIGGGAANATSALAREGAAALKTQGLDLDDFSSQAMALLRDTGKPDLPPEKLGAAGERLGEDVKSAVGNAAKQPATSNAEIRALIDKIVAKGGEALDATDRQAAINVLVARSNMSEAEAARTVDQWQQMFSQAQAKVKELKTRAEAQARETGDKVAHAVAQAAAWSAVAMVLGAVAASLGGALGVRDWRRFSRAV